MYPSHPSSCEQRQQINKNNNLKFQQKKITYYHNKFSFFKNSYYRLFFCLFILTIILSQTKYQVNAQTLPVLTTCHYSCTLCLTIDYYQCVACQTNRGVYNTTTSLYQPVYGMCYCQSQNDEDNNGNCLNSSSYNYNNKALITSFIALSIIFGLLMILIRGMRYYFLKVIQDVQELSLIVFINLYFPQQFDVYLSHLYRFNMSSYTFESLANGSLFVFDQQAGILSTDGQNIFGKYKLLFKTANFFSNCFTWIIVALIIIVFCLSLWGARKFWKKKARQEYKNNHQSQFSSQYNLDNHQNKSQQNNIQIISKGGRVMQQGGGDQYIARMKQNYKLKKLHQSTVQLQQKTTYKILNTLTNMFWLTIPLHFFYFSLIQLNINIFTQIGNLTFSSSFAAIGAFFSAVFLALQMVLFYVLFLKTRQQCIKPQWMRDFTYSPCFYLIRTNFKTLTKYFWFISCGKKILFALFMTLLYQDPVSSIIAISTVEALFILIAIYCQPYERRYLRVHFYLTQGFKLFMFVSLLNFSQKYTYNKQLIDITQIFYIVLSLIFGMHLGWILMNLIIQWKVYWFAIKKRISECCSQFSAKQQSEGTKPKQQTKENFGRTQGMQDQNNGDKEKNMKNKKLNGSVNNNSQLESEFNNKDLIQQNNVFESSSFKYPFEGSKIGYFSQGKMHYYDKI